MGEASRKHIHTVADPSVSVARLEGVLEAVLAGRDNPFQAQDLENAKRAVSYLDEHEFGHSLGEQCALRLMRYRVLFHRWRKGLKTPAVARGQV
jgi:hypothetical protein